MITAEKILKTFESSIFSASFFADIRHRVKIKITRFGTCIARHLFRHEIAWFFLVILIGLGSLLTFRALSVPPRSNAENILLALSLEERLLYADGIEALVREDPDALTHLVGLDIFLLFDEPLFIRHESTLVVWQYKTPSCVLDLYLDTSQMADAVSSPVVFQETRSSRKPSAPPFDPVSQNDKSLDGIDARACLDSLLKTSRPGRTDRLLLSGHASDI